MPATDERLADFCETIWLQLRDLDPYDILVVLTALSGDVVGRHDNPELLLEDVCEMLAKFARETAEAERPPRPTLRLVPREPG